MQGGHRISTVEQPRRRACIPSTCTTCYTYLPTRKNKLSYLGTCARGGARDVHKCIALHTHNREKKERESSGGSPGKRKRKREKGSGGSRGSVATKRESGESRGQKRANQRCNRRFFGVLPETRSTGETTRTKTDAQPILRDLGLWKRKKQTKENRG